MGKRGKHKKMRLFIGIPIRNAAQEDITGYYSLFKGVKTVKKENLHVTLQFLGDINDILVEPVIKAIDLACRDIKMFEMTMTRISAFPHTRNARVVWVNIEKGAGAVKKVFRYLEQSLKEIKYEKENRAFIPHITIARSKQGIDISEIAGVAKFNISSGARQVALFKSDLEESGPVYTKIYEKALGEAGNGEQ